MYTYIQTKNQEGKLLKACKVINYYPLLEMDVKDLHQSILLLDITIFAYLSRRTSTYTNNCIAQKLQDTNYQSKSPCLKTKAITECSDVNYATW